MQVLLDENNSESNDAEDAKAPSPTEGNEPKATTTMTLILEDTEGVSGMTAARQLAFEEWITIHARAASVFETDSARLGAISPLASFSYNITGFYPHSPDSRLSRLLSPLARLAYNQALISTGLLSNQAFISTRQPLL
jgi:hypothetical protein